MVKLSVIVPVYNVEQYLARCLDSLINQTYQDLEIICVNDGSKDNCGQILDEYAARDKRIMVIKQENAGLSAARNTGMKAARGELIGFVDSDDWVEPETYAEAVKAMADGVDLVCWGAKVVCDEEFEELEGIREYHRVKQNGIVELTDRVKRQTACTAWNKLYRKSIIDRFQIEFPRGLLYEDIAFFWKYNSVITKAAFLDKYFYNYVQRKDSIIGQMLNKKSAKMTDRLAIGFDIYQFYEAQKLLKPNLDNILYLFECLLHLDYRYCDKKFRPLVLQKATEYALRMKLGRRAENSQLIKSLRKCKYHNIMSLGIRNLKELLYSVNDYSDRKIVRLAGVRFTKKNKSSRKAIASALAYLSSQAEGEFNSKTSDACCFNENVAAALHNLGKFVFYPNYGNLGDVAIAAAEYQFFEQNSADFIPSDRFKNEDFNLVYGGGGIWNPCWDYGHVLQLFARPEVKQAVIMPSSFYQCDDLFEVLDERFTVFCREQQSYDYAVSKNHKARFCLANDMVFGLDITALSDETLTSDDQKAVCGFLRENPAERLADWYDGAFYEYERVYSRVAKVESGIITNNKGMKIGCFMRTDGEKCPDSADFGKGFDLSLCVGNDCLDAGLVKLFTRLFLAAIAKTDIVVTDRLHIGICAALSGKEVYLLDNNYGKLSNVYKQSMGGMANVHLVPRDDWAKTAKSVKTISAKRTATDEPLKRMNYSFAEFALQYLKR